MALVNWLKYTQLASSIAPNPSPGIGGFQVTLQKADLAAGRFGCLRVLEIRLGFASRDPVQNEKAGFIVSKRGW